MKTEANEVVGESQEKITPTKTTDSLESDVTNMISAEMGLPRRLIICSSEIIFKKTAGHCIFIHQLLNSLVNSIIVYSPTKHRYDWDIERLKVLPTSDNVADFIVADHVNHFSSRSLETLLSSYGFYDIDIDSKIHTAAYVVSARVNKSDEDAT